MEHPSSGMLGHAEPEGVALVGLGVGFRVGLEVFGILLRHLHLLFTSCGKYPHSARGTRPP